MKKDIPSYTLLKVAVKKPIYLAIFLVLLAYLVFELISILSSNYSANIYDYIIKITNFYSFSYMLIPLFLIFLLTFFSGMTNLQYFLYRFKNRERLFLSSVGSLSILSLCFTGSIVFIVSCASLFSLSYDNKWSQYALSPDHFYSFLTVGKEESYHFFDYCSPLIYTVNNILLMFLMFFTYALLFYVVFLISANHFISLLIVLGINIVNIVAELLYIHEFTPFSMVKHVIPFEYIATYDLEGISFPYQIYTFWVIGLILLLGLSWFLSGRCDFKMSQIGENQYE